MRRSDSTRAPPTTRIALDQKGEGSKPSSPPNSRGQARRRPAHELDRLSAREACDIGQPHERLDPRGASDRENKPPEIAFRQLAAERGQSLPNPSDRTALAQREIAPVAWVGVE